MSQIHTRAELVARVQAYFGVERSARRWLDAEIARAIEAGVSSRTLGRIVGSSHQTILTRYNRHKDLYRQEPRS